MRLALLLLVSALAHAQGAPCTRAQPVGHVAGVVAAYLEPTYPTLSLPPEYVAGVLTAIRNSFRAPDPLDYATFELLRHDTATLAMSAAAEFEITKDGAVEHVHLLGSSLSKPFDAAIVGAIAKADSDQLILPPPKVKDRAFLRLTTSVTAAELAGAGSLIHLSVPIWTSSTDIQKLPHAKKLEYPLTGRLAEKSDFVVAQFVVDDSGAVVPSATYVVRATWRDFGLSVLHYLMQARYAPGTVGGCPAAMMVRAPFTYMMSSY